MSMGALMMGNLLQDFVASEDMDFEDRKWVWMRYGALLGNSDAETPSEGNLAERRQICLHVFCLDSGRCRGWQGVCY